MKRAAILFQSELQSGVTGLLTASEAYRSRFIQIEKVGQQDTAKLTQQEMTSALTH